ncbi:MAG: PhoH family protein [Lentisphaeria bacterium]|nr:PhoH family protein [Lentisphaeria bacterium]
MSKIKTFVLDTNVLLHSARALESFAENRVVIPMTVIEELDKFKKNQDELGRNSRRVVRALDSLRKEGSLSEGVRLNNGPGGEPCGIVQVVTGEDFEKVPRNMDMHIPDNRIIRAALMLKDQPEKYGEVTLISKDLNMRLRADALGLQVDDFESQKVSYSSLYTGSSELEVPDLDKFFMEREMPAPEGREFYPNQFLRLKAMGTNKTGLGLFRDGKILQAPPLPEDKVWNIKPRSIEQRMALILLMDPAVQVVSLVGQAGSGKTLLALAAALEQLKMERYERILVSRPIIPMGNDIGYLPGDKDEKLSVWMQPIYDNLDYLLHTGKQNNDNLVRKKIEEMRRAGKLELEALTYIRGRSIPRQYVIIDEAQNLTPHEVKTIVSRAGEDTKMVFTGDPEQIDNPYLDASSNGLTYMAERFKKVSMHGHVTLKKSERSPLAAAAATYL